jgi:hypothetical protein
MNVDQNLLPLAVSAAALLAVVALPALVALLNVRWMAALRPSEYRFEALSEHALPRGAARWFERHTPAMLALGFAPLGDYEVRPGLLARFFASPQGRVFGCLAYRRGVWQYRRTYSFSTVFADGTYLESASLARPAGMPTPVPALLFEFVPAADVRQLYEHHGAAIAREEVVGGRECLSFAPEQFRDVSAYGYRLVRWDLAEKGLAPAPPAPAEGVGHAAAS